MFKWPWKKEKEEPKVEPSLPLVVVEEDFNKSRIAGITFSADRLPYLKNLLSSYEESMEERRVKNKEYAQLKDSLESFTREFSYFFKGEWAEQRKTQGVRWLPDQEAAARIICAYSGTILDTLQELRDKGWDGKNKYYEDYKDSYKWDVLSRLRALVEALEAGNAQAELNIPSEFRSEYEIWFTNAISFAVKEGKGPAAGNTTKYSTKKEKEES